MLVGGAAILVGGAAVGGAAAAAGTYGVYRQKKKKKQNEERHRQMLLKMQPQWQDLMDNETNINTDLYPKVYAEIDDDEAVRLPKKTSFGMGFKEAEKLDGMPFSLFLPHNINKLFVGSQFQMFVTAFDVQGREIETLTYEKKQSSDLPGVRHSGYHSKPKEGRL